MGFRRKPSIATATTILASQIPGVVLDCDLATGAKIGGGTPTDNTAVINAVLASASAEHPVELVMDGGAAIRNLQIPSNVTIEGQGLTTGFFCLGGSNDSIIRTATKWWLPRFEVVITGGAEAGTHIFLHALDARPYLDPGTVPAVVNGANIRSYWVCQINGVLWYISYSTTDSCYYLSNALHGPGTGDAWKLTLLESPTVTADSEMIGGIQVDYIPDVDGETLAWVPTEGTTGTVTSEFKNRSTVAPVQNIKLKNFLLNCNGAGNNALAYWVRAIHLCDVDGFEISDVHVKDYLSCPQETMVDAAWGLGLYCCSNGKVQNVRVSQTNGVYNGDAIHVGDLKNVDFVDCELAATGDAITLDDCGDGNGFENVSFVNCSIENTGGQFFLPIRLYGKLRPGKKWKNVRFQGITGMLTCTSPNIAMAVFNGALGDGLFEDVRFDSLDSNFGVQFNTGGLIELTPPSQRVAGDYVFASGQIFDELQVQDGVPHLRGPNQVAVVQDGITLIFDGRRPLDLTLPAIKVTIASGGDLNVTPTVDTLSRWTLPDNTQLPAGDGGLAITGADAGEYKYYSPASGKITMLSLDFCTAEISSIVADADLSPSVTQLGVVYSSITMLSLATFPNLTSFTLETCDGLADLDLLNLPLASLTIDANADLETLTGLAGLIPTADSDLMITNNPLLAALNFGSAHHIALDISGNTSLASVTLICTAMMSLNANGCALTEGQVDAILAGLAAAGLAGFLCDLSGGTSAPPSAAGLASMATMITNGWPSEGVLVNT